MSSSINIKKQISCIQKVKATNNNKYFFKLLLKFQFGTPIHISQTLLL